MMIEAKELKTLEDFEALKKGDFVAVEWRRDVSANKRGTKRTRFATYEIADNLESQTEIEDQRKEPRGDDDYPSLKEEADIIMENGSTIKFGETSSVQDKYYGIPDNG